MAKVYSVPVEIPEPVTDFKNYNHALELQKEEDYIAALKAWLRKERPGELVGELIRHHVADGYALYMVAAENPLALVHLTLGDAYSAGAVWERGLRLADVRQMVERERKIASLWNHTRETAAP